MTDRPIDPTRQGVSQEPEMEDKAIASARRAGFVCGLASVGAIGILATAPKTVGYWPADAALFLVGVTLTCIAWIAPAYALSRHNK